ncbi:hypothetical protein [Bauldia litoralis]
MDCRSIKDALARFHDVVDTVDGCRVLTHCLYPSFDPVEVYVVRLGDGFRVHDGGGAERAAWTHGRTDNLIGKMMRRHATRYNLAVRDGAIVGEAPSIEWVASAILSVANASAAAAVAAVDRAVAVAEDELADAVFGVLRRRVGEQHVTREYAVSGNSGRTYHFDFGIVRPNRKLILIDTVVPHHSSISHKYVAFSDVATDNNSGPDRWAVFDKPLSQDNASLMRQVADLVPVNRLDDAMAREVHLN